MEGLCSACVSNLHKSFMLPFWTPQDGLFYA